MTQSSFLAHSTQLLDGCIEDREIPVAAYFSVLTGVAPQGSLTQHVFRLEIIALLGESEAHGCRLWPPVQGRVQCEAGTRE